MSASDWDVLMLDNNGQSIITTKVDGTCESIGSNQASVEIYKGSILVSHKKMWYEGSGFCEPIIARIRGGNIEVGGLNIQSKWDELNSSLFFYITEPAPADSDILDRVVVSGIAIDGYIDEVEWLKLKHKEVYEQIPEKFRTDTTQHSCSHIYRGKNVPVEWQLNFCTESNERYTFTPLVPKSDLNDLWQGITADTITSFIEWLNVVSFPVASGHYVSKINSASIQRFCQGDLIMANLCNIPIVDATTVEKNRPPIAAEIITQFSK